MKKINIVLLTLLILVILFVPQYFIQHAKQAKLVKAAAETEVQSVKVMKLEADSKPIEITLPSYLEAINFTTLWARTDGYLTNFLVDIGDKITEGQLLALIDTPDIDEQLARAEGELASYIAKEAIARITAERWTSLYSYNPETLSREEVDRTVAAFESAAADVVAAKANVDYWKYRQGFNHIYAPYTGIVTERDTIDIGTLITAGSTNNPIRLFQVAKTDVLRAFVDVPQPLFYLIKDGLQAVATVWEYPGKSYCGVIDRNAGALDPQARTLLTQVNIDNQAGDLMPGLYAEVKFSFTPEQKTFIVPIGALIIRNGPPYLAVVNRNVVHLQQVTIGTDNGNWIEIVEGIHDGDQIIVNPTDLTRDGNIVKVVLITDEEKKMLFGGD